MRKGGYGVYTKSKMDEKRISKYFAPLSEPGDDPMQEWSSLSRPGYSETEERKVIIIVGEKCICLLSETKPLRPQPRLMQSVAGGEQEHARDCDGSNSGSSLFSLIGGFWPERSLVELSLTFQFRVVKAAGVAERPRAVGAAPPFGRVDPVTAVAPAGRSGAL